MSDQLRITLELRVDRPTQDKIDAKIAQEIKEKVELYLFSHAINKRKGKSEKLPSLASYLHSIGIFTDAEVVKVKQGSNKFDVRQ